MEQIYKEEAYVVLHCSSCSIGFGVPQSFEQSRRADRKDFFCPAGHSQWFPGKTQNKVIEELKAQVASKDDLLQSTRRERDKHWRLLRAAEGKAKAIRMRVSAGVCLCCNRTFQDLARHMQTKHPSFGK